MNVRVVLVVDCEARAIKRVLFPHDLEMSAINPEKDAVVDCIVFLEMATQMCIAIYYPRHLTMEEIENITIEAIGKMEAALSQALHEIAEYESPRGEDGGEADFDPA